MASSVSRQDEPNRAVWLGTQAGKMELSCPLRTTRRALREKFSRKPNNKSFIDQAFLVNMAGYWPHPFFATLWTEMKLRSMNMQKKNLANIHPSWSHTWSITHIYMLISNNWSIQSYQQMSEQNLNFFDYLSFFCVNG